MSAIPSRGEAFLAPTLYHLRLLTGCPTSKSTQPSSPFHCNFIRAIIPDSVYRLSNNITSAASSAEFDPRPSIRYSETPIRRPNHALPHANTNITPLIPMTLTIDPNDSATHPKKLIPSMDVAVAIAV